MGYDTDTSVRARRTRPAIVPVEADALADAMNELAAASSEFGILADAYPELPGLTEVERLNDLLTETGRILTDARPRLLPRQEFAHTLSCTARTLRLASAIIRETTGG